jgi:tape measure domain-containing protein
MDDELASLFVKIGADMSGLFDAFEEAGRATKKLGEQISQVGQQMTTYVTAPLLGFGAAAVVAAGESDRLEKALVAVTGDAAEAGRQMERLREIARAPGLGFAEAIQASVSLQAVDVDAQTAERAIRLFGNALATTGGTKESFAEVIRQFVQIQSLGKVTAENLNVIKEQAPAIAGALQDAFAGVDLTKLPVAQFNDALFAQLEQLGTAAPSLLEPFTNAFDDAKAAAVPFGETVAELVTPVVQDLVAVATQLSAAFAALPADTREVIVVLVGVVAATGPLLVALGAIVTIAPAVALAWVAITGPIGLLVMAFSGLVVGVVLFRDELNVLNGRINVFANELRVTVLGALADAAEGLSEFRDEFPALYQALAAVVPGFRSAVNGADGLADSFRDAQKAALIDLSHARSELAQLAHAAEDAALAANHALAALSALGRGRLLSGRGGPRVGDPLQLPDGTEAAGAGAPFTPIPAGSGPETVVRAAKPTAAQELAAELKAISDGVAASLLGIQTRVRDGVMLATDVVAASLQALDQAYGRALDAAEGRATSTSAALLAQARRVRGEVEMAPLAPWAARTGVNSAGREAIEEKERAKPEEQIREVVELSALLGETVEAVLDSVGAMSDGVGSAVGDVFFRLAEGRSVVDSLGEGIDNLGRTLNRVMAQAVADIGSAIARMLFLKALTAVFGGGLGLGMGGSLFSTGKMAAPAMAINLNTNAGEMRLSGGYLVALLRTELQNEVRSGRGDGNL